MLREARKLSAHGLADDAEREAMAATPTDVSVRKLRADMLWRKASVYNRAELGQQAPAGAGITLNLDTLYLQALMAPLTQKALPEAPKRLEGEP